MESYPIRHGCRWALIGSALLVIGTVRDAVARQVPTQEAFGGAAPAPSTPTPPNLSLPTVAAEALPLPREAQLEQRVRQLETMVQQLSG